VIHICKEVPNILSVFRNWWMLRHIWKRGCQRPIEVFPRRLTKCWKWQRNGSAEYATTENRRLRRM